FQVPAVYAFFSLICHQNPARSWELFGNPLAVCIRCASIYFGFFGALLLPFAPNVRRLKAAILLSIAEFLFAQFVTDIGMLRALSGLAVGGSAAPFVRVGVEQMLSRVMHDSM